MEAPFGKNAMKVYLPYSSYYNKKRMSRSFTQMYNYEHKLI